MTFNGISDVVVLVIEATGMAVVVVGMLVGVAYALYRFADDRDLENLYMRARHGMGRSLMLGLDLLIASEIIRSIHAETMKSVTVLGITVVIRTFLSMTLMVEIEGRWPWTRHKEMNDE
jgi:uncharacterized membrane protein